MSGFRKLLLVSLAATMGAPAGGAPEAANNLLHTAKGNLQKVSLAMETVSSLAKEERVRLRTTMQELRVKNSYILHDRLRAAQGIKIAATGLEEAIAGSAVMVYK